MSNDPTKTFKYDHILRDYHRKPIGRVVLVGDFEPISALPVALLEVPKSIMKSVKGRIFYIDGDRYKAPLDIPDIRITETSNKIIANNIMLKKVGSE